MNSEIQLIGSKFVEIPYFAGQLASIDVGSSILIIGERKGGEGVGETIKAMGFENVTTTDIVEIESGSWLDVNRGNWKHVQTDFIQYDEREKYDVIISVSVFEHFGLWFYQQRPGSSLLDRNDTCRWNHDIRGIIKACKLLKNADSKLIVTVPAGPFMNYEPTGEPLLRSYDSHRQSIVKAEISNHGFEVTHEEFFFSENFTDWRSVGPEVNSPANYRYHNPFTPNVIWAFTVKPKQ